MIEFVFTIDYEIYGNGEGSLRDLVYEPANELMSLFKEFDSSFVVFAEALEFRKMEEHQSDAGIASVRDQLRRLLDEGFEIGMHLHPWWFNAQRKNGGWHLNWSERNLCAAPEERVDEVVQAALAYLRQAVGMPGFTPCSFRGGLWLMQPTKTMAGVLSRHGMRVDSSVFKGGRIQDVGLDYRPALKNGYFWQFRDDVNRAETQGILFELPIHTEMVPFWKMISSKRMGLHRKVPTNGNGGPLPSRWGDFARFRYPRKLDFCRMSFDELRSGMDSVLREDQRTPQSYKPVVAIGHTKDLVDFDTIRRFLEYLRQNGIPVSDFRGVLRRLGGEHG